MCLSTLLTKIDLAPRRQGGRHLGVRAIFENIRSYALQKLGTTLGTRNESAYMPKPKIDKFYSNFDNFKGSYGGFSHNNHI